MTGYGRRRWAGLVFISIAVAMVVVDVTIVNVVLPVIVASLKTGSATAQWIGETYTLTLAALLVTAGRVADLIGRRLALLLGLGVFLGGSVLAALAPSGAALVTARFFQGVGGAAILPCTLALINATFRGKERATAYAVWGSVIGGLAAAGPLLGGVLATEFSWRWAFWINLVLGGIAVAGILACVAESRQPHAGRDFDLPGVLLSVVALASLVYGLTEGRILGWRTALPGHGGIVAGLSPVPAVFALALAAGTLFLHRQRRRCRAGRGVVVDLALFGVPAFARGNVIVFLVALGQLGLLFVLPLWLQNVLGYTATGTGLLLVPVAVGAFLAAGVTPAAAEKLGVPWVLRTGLAAEIAALAGLAAVADLEARGWALVPVLAVYGFGVGTAEAQLPSVVLRDVPVTQSGQGSGVQTTAQELGSVMGIAVLGTILFTSLSAGLADRLRHIPLPPGQRAAVEHLITSSAGTAIRRLHDPRLLHAAQQAFSAATRNAALAAAGCLALGLLATAVLPEGGARSPATENAGEEASETPRQEDPHP